MAIITVIGRGHSGTRAIAHTLYASGVFMGSALNRSGDKVPPHALYDACRVMAKYVKWKGGLEWDFDDLHSAKIDPEFEDLIGEYLRDVAVDRSEHKGWKLPETDVDLPVDCADVSRHPLHSLDPRPARQHHRCPQGPMT